MRHRAARLALPVFFGLAVLTGFAAVVAIWVERQAFETEQWVETSEQLIADEEIRGALANFLTDELFSSDQRGEPLERVLPDRLDPLAGTLASGLRDLTHRLALRLLETPKVQDLWVEANRDAHVALLDLIDDRPITAPLAGIAEEKADSVHLDLTEIKSRLAAQVGLDVPVAGRGGSAANGSEAIAAIEILAPNELELAQDIGRLLKPASIALLLLTLALLAAAIVVTPAIRRRNTVIACGIAVLLVGVLALGVREVVGDVVVSALAGSSSVEPATAAAWGIGTSLLHEIGVATAIYGLAILAAAWATGPSRPATALRSATGPVLGQRLLAYTAALLLIVLMVLWAPTEAFRRPLGVAIFAVLVLALAEALRRQAARETLSS